ncbi:hypothetical protein [Pseudarthrobacter sp. NamB4]|uniref:hypothetical protein n=1 Tax=Pseudarthrobacter sp. NamB4 TaxID=2576837 RepID=UPI0010FE4AE0|nr:hypothetical protein [Pseudarthrobacter sp. NamB4]TLM74544.1 hypothetical protein FDW81_04825 [Pseudarthrobacter sp. NamB4]
MTKDKADHGGNAEAEVEDEAGQVQRDPSEPGQDEEPEVSQDRWEDPPTYPHAPGFNPDYWPKF